VVGREKNLVFWCLGCWTPNEEKKNAKGEDTRSKNKTLCWRGRNKRERERQREREREEKEGAVGEWDETLAHRRFGFFSFLLLLCVFFVLLDSFSVKEREVGFEKIGKKQRTFLVEIHTTSDRWR